ncbi:MAG: PrgI family protein [Candidatus Brennerbacteria bacterium]|nr:PrgI family protein [Candidatus Brennerbacteria bacterium]
MATFQVPQFIEQKPKIIGPFTLEQFLYIAAAGVLSFFAFYIFNFFFWFLLTILLAGAAIALAFVKVNGQRMPTVIKSAFSYLWRPRTYTWQRAITQTVLDTSELEKLEETRSKMGVQERLKSIALSVSTGKIFSPKKWREEKDRYQVVTRITGEREVAKRVDY